MAFPCQINRIFAPVEHNFSECLFTIRTESDFNRLALDLFRFQAVHNPVYAQFVEELGLWPEAVSDVRGLITVISRGTC